MAPHIPSGQGLVLGGPLGQDIPPAVREAPADASLELGRLVTSTNAFAALANHHTIDLISYPLGFHTYYIYTYAWGIALDATWFVLFFYARTNFDKSRLV